MHATLGIRRLAAGLGLLLLPIGALGHEIVPWGSYPTAGDVVVATKAKRLLDDTFIGQILTVTPAPITDGAYEVGLGTGVPTVYGQLMFTNRKGSKAKLSVLPAALDPWIARVASLLRQYLESRGAVVQDLVVATKKAGGTATFKTRPTPIGPLHKASVAITIKFTAVATLEGGRTKKGIVTMAVTSKGALLGLPGGD